VPNLAAALLRRGGAWRHLGPALELVERELARPLAVDELAAALGCSREHCARLFRRHLGQSPVRYIQEQRVARAVQFIRQGEPLESVARRVGVGTRQYLGRLISRHLGQTAAAWR
jgi:transcriptional regulator GlxA family with amidase domain